MGYIRNVQSPSLAGPVPLLLDRVSEESHQILGLLLASRVDLLAVGGSSNAANVGGHVELHGGLAHIKHRGLAEALDDQKLRFLRGQKTPESSFHYLNKQPTKLRRRA